MTRAEFWRAVHQRQVTAAWFRAAMERGALPKKPFRLWSWLFVAVPEKFYAQCLETIIDPNPPLTVLDRTLQDLGRLRGMIESERLEGAGAIISEKELSPHHIDIERAPEAIVSLVTAISDATLSRKRLRNPETGPKKRPKA